MSKTTSRSRVLKVEDFGTPQASGERPVLVTSVSFAKGQGYVISVRREFHRPDGIVSHVLTESESALVFRMSRFQEAKLFSVEQWCDVEHFASRLRAALVARLDVSRAV